MQSSTKTMKKLGLYFGCFFLTIGSAFAAHQEVWVATDRTVDCSSLETIIRDSIKPDMNEEQKAVALFNTFRRLVFHHLNTPESRDPLKLFNVLGYTLCGSQGTVNKALLQAAGFEARVVAWPNGAHTFYEVKYNDRWHVFDTMTNFYVFTRDDPRHVASMDELKADPTLATNAAKEGRSCPGFLMCEDGAAPFTKGWKELNYNATKSNYSPKKLSLYKGMEFVRDWTCSEKASPKSWQADGPGPKHTCGGKDDRSIENFIWWEPYLVKNMGKTSRSYRHWGGGRVLYSPDLRSAEWKDSAKDPVNLVSGKDGAPALHPEAAGKDAVWTFVVQTPYYITDGFVTIKARKKNAEDVLKIEASMDGKTWKPVVSLDEVGEKTVKGAAAPTIVKPCPGAYSCHFKVTMNASKEPADVGLDGVYFRIAFQHNYMSAPALLPGKNKVSLTAVSAKEGEFSPIDFVYEYQEGPSWNASPVKNVSFTLKEPKGEFEAELAESPKHHRMKSLTYRSGKLAWVPEEGAGQ
jgi:hypothetical protein